MRTARQIAAAASALLAYRTTVLPVVRRQLRCRRRQAETLPDPRTRRLALAALNEKAGNVEAVAVFATLAPRPVRRAALEAIVPLQVAVDYLDSREEEGSRFEAQADAYNERLQAAWRRAVAVLPSAAATQDLIERAVERSAEGQSRTHAAEHGDPQALERWAHSLPSTPGYRWWELAAGASSSVAGHALIAAAAVPGTQRAEAELIDAAYNPSIGALTVLLDDLVDREQDAATGAHNYTGYYGDPAEAAECIAAIARTATTTIALLPGRQRHEAILAGVAAFYLSQPGARLPFGRPIGDALRKELGRSVDLIAAAIRS